MRARVHRGTRRAETIALIRQTFRPAPGCSTRNFAQNSASRPSGGNTCQCRRKCSPAAPTCTLLRESETFGPIRLGRRCRRVAGESRCDRAEGRSPTGPTQTPYPGSVESILPPSRCPVRFARRAQVRRLRTQPTGSPAGHGRAGPRPALARRPSLRWRSL